jgi:outer membrane protein with beta-barrel domain
MNKPGLLTRSIVIIFILGFVIFTARAGDWEGQPHIKSTVGNMETPPGETEKLLKKKNKFFNLDVDVQLGLDMASTSIDVQKYDTNTQKLQSTDTRLGPTIGAIVDFDFLGFGFTTGAQYSSKGFETQGNIATNYNYINIPLFFYVGFEAGKIRIDAHLGPYFGLLISQDESTVLKIKNFDLGLSGNLSGAYMFNKYMGVLLGCKYEYGGLNNLASNEFIKKVTSSTLFFYSGLKFEL